MYARSAPSIVYCILLFHTLAENPLYLETYVA